MKRIFAVVLVAGLLLMLAWTPAFSAGPWLDNIDEAAAKAKAENKLVLAEFTGSDWCHWCIKMHEEVTTKEAWLTEIQKDFVLVSIDFLQSSPMPNPDYVQSMLEKYGIQGFPTLLVLNDKGVPVSNVETSFMDGVDGVLEKMRAAGEEGKKTQAKVGELTKIMMGEGEAKDRAAAAVTFFDLTEGFSSFYPEEYTAMATLDPSNEFGLGEKMKLRELFLSGMPTKETAADSETRANEVLAMQNLSEDGVRLGNLFLSIALQTQGKTEEAAAAAEKVKGLKSFMGQEFNYENYINWLQSIQ